jgi:hypothetical protein
MDTKTYVKRLKKMLIKYEGKVCCSGLCPLGRFYKWSEECVTNDCFVCLGFMEGEENYSYNIWDPCPCMYYKRKHMSAEAEAWKRIKAWEKENGEVEG